MKVMLLSLTCSLIFSGCATASKSASSDSKEAQEQGSSAHPGIAELLDAQMRAIGTGAIKEATEDFSPQALFVGPGVDEQGVDSEARIKAQERFSALYAQGFSPTPPKRLIGGEDLASVRWSVDRFASKGQMWAVTTLFEGPAPWRILAQSWDMPDEDRTIIQLAFEAKMPPIGRFPDDITETDSETLSWVKAHISMTAQSSLTMPMNIKPPLRGDSFSLGSAAEYAQSDEAILYGRSKMRPMIESGQYRFAPIKGAGSILRMSKDQKAGAILSHTGYILEGPRGDFELPMKGVGYFIQSAHGPRMIGGHLLATP